MFTPVEPEEAEITIIGQGYGETILIHTCYDEWIIIDSCASSQSDSPYALTYLDQIGVNLDNVKLVVATHWHDDHINGLSKIIESCPNASFACSGALKPKEFLTLIDAYGKNTTIYKSGIKEFYEIIKTLRYREFSGKGNPNPKFSIADRALWTRKSTASEKISSSIYSLSPSDASVINALKFFSNLVPLPGSIVTHPLPKHDNHTSVALWVDIGEVSILLGSDLQETKDEHTGWSIIVKSSLVAEGKACVFKVPHHGSDNGHCDSVWEEMLSSETYALITPFNNGSVFLPDDSDITRINSLAGDSVITNTPKL